MNKEIKVEINIYEKLQNARVELQDMKLKKSGKNQGFSYYELSDLLPAINELCKKYGLFTKFDIAQDNGIEMAVLSIRDNNNIVKFLSPTAEVTLRGGQAIQALGAKITYLRRYLLINAFEVVENDMVDLLKKAMAEELSQEDLSEIDNAKDFDDLTKICGVLKKKYKVGLIKEFYDKRKQELEVNKKENEDPKK